MDIIVNFLKSNVIDLAAWFIAIATAMALERQIKDSKEYNEQSHELQRRMNAANIMFNWSANLTMEESVAKRIAEKFDRKQAMSLFKEDSFSINSSDYEVLKVVLENKKSLENSNLGISLTYSNKSYEKITEMGKDVCVTTDKHKDNSSKDADKSTERCEDCPRKSMIELSKEEVVLLRWYVMHYLNNLECVLLQCKIGIVDIDVMYEQFKYQYNTRDGVMALKTFRDVAGGVEAYPAIEWFCIKLEEKIKKDILEKGKVDK